MSGPLAGVTVIDLTWFLAGPFCTMVLADLGAEVIKIEQPGVGDPTRKHAPFVGGLSSYFLSVNRGKRSLTLNLKAPQGRDTLLALVQQADVLVESFTPGTMGRLGLGYPTLAERNPRLVYAAISGFGQSGPLAPYPAFDVVVQARAGTMSITGEPGRPPTRVGFSAGDLGGSLFGAIGILAALQERERSGRGQQVDVALLDCQVALLENAFARYFASGEPPGPQGSRHPLVTPFQAFATADSHLVVAVSPDARWAGFCRVLEREDLLADTRYATNVLRTANREPLTESLAQTFRQRTTADWLARLEAAEVPCGPLQNVAQAAADPQIQAREMIVEVPTPSGESVRLVNHPLKFSRTPGAARGGPPALGQHADAVLRERLDLTPSDLERLRAEGVI